MFFIRFKRFLNPDQNLIFAVYFSCALLFGLVVKLSGSESVSHIVLHPLSDSYSVLGAKVALKGNIPNPRVYAFLPYWTVGKNINLGQVTDLAYFGLHVDAKGRIVTSDGPYSKWRESKDLGDHIKKIKQQGGRGSLTLICHQDSDIDAILECRECWENLFLDVKKELIWGGVKDVNLDFEYSGYTTVKKAQLYSELVGYLNSRLDATFGDSFVVVSAYADSADKVERAWLGKGKGAFEDFSTEEKDTSFRLTEPRSLAQVADAIFIMAYDFHLPTSKSAGPVSPFAGSYSTTRLNLVKVLDGYLKFAPPEKVILGLPFYGYDWVVESAEPMSARIEGSDLIGFSKSRTYAEIVDFMVKKQIKPLWDEVSKTPYFNYVDEELDSKRQVWYDNEDSLVAKSALVRGRGLLGVGVWALGFEGGYSDIWKFVDALH